MNQPIVKAPQSSPTANSRRAYTLLVITAACWGGNTVFGKLAVGHISPMLLVTLRWLVVIILLALFSRQQILRDWSILRQHLGFVALMGVIGFTAFNALFYLAAHSTSALNIGIIQGVIPVFVIVGSFFILKTPIKLVQIFGIGTTFAGILVIASSGDFSQFEQWSISHGDFFMLLACLLYAAYSIGLSRRPPVSSLSLFALMAGAAFIASVPLLLIEIYYQGFDLPTQTGWTLVILVALLPSFIAQLFFIQSVSIIGPGRAGVFINLVPVFASIMAVLFLAEKFEAYHGISLALVLSGIALSEVGKVK